MPGKHAAPVPPSTITPRLVVVPVVAGAVTLAGGAPAVAAPAAALPAASTLELPRVSLAPVTAAPVAAAAVTETADPLERAFPLPLTPERHYYARHRPGREDRHFNGLESAGAKADVQAIQGRLGVTRTGYFGLVTDGAVRAFQRGQGIVVDGLVGPITWSRLQSPKAPAVRPPATISYALGAVRPHVRAAAYEIGPLFGITRIGGYRSGSSGEHPQGLAIDLMTTVVSKGDAISAYTIRHAERLKVYYVIWNRQIWFPTRGRRAYNGPSPHTDHVHISFRP